MRTFLVSVVIPTHDRARSLARAVESVLGQRDADFEVIVVDDGSTDDTAARIEPFLGGGVRYVWQENRGVSAARNRGAREARGEWLAFLDSDDEWRPKKLALQVAFHRRHPDVRISQTGEIWIRNGVRVNPCRHHAKPSGDIFLPSLERCLVTPSAAMLRRDLFEEVGGFDESLPVCEDYDLWLRIASRHHFGLLPDPLVVKYGGHADQLSRRYWGMDRFRVVALRKLLADPEIAGERRQAVREALRRKCSILASGARRRNRHDEAREYLALVQERGAPAPL